MTPEALGEIYEAEHGTLTRSVERITGDRAAAEDLVHDAFVAYLASSPGADRPGAWLSRVARNRALNHIRRSTSLPLVERAGEDAAEGGPEREAVRAVVAGALGALHDRDRRALHARFFEGADYPEVAELLGVRVEQCHVIVHRAVRRLGREVVRRLAAAHGAQDCEGALAGAIGLAVVADHHQGSPCGRCRPAWDELAALRSLPALAPIAVGPGTLRRIIGRIWTRAAGLTDLSQHVAGAAVGFAVVASSIAPGGAIAASRAATAPIAERRPTPSLTRTATAPAAATVRSATTSRTAARAPLNAPASNLGAGGTNVSANDDHAQVDSPPAPDGTTGTGLIVCKPLEPCPPPPSPQPSSEAP